MTNLALINVANRSSAQIASAPIGWDPAIVQAYVAGGAILPNRLVEFTAVAGQVTQVNAATDLLLGVYVGDVSAATGDQVPVAILGIATAEAGEAITQGAMLASDTVGRVVVAATTERLIGKALQTAAAAGSLIKILISDHSLVV
jgi:hypothetical protein